MQPDNKWHLIDMKTSEATASATGKSVAFSLLTPFHQSIISMESDHSDYDNEPSLPASDVSDDDFAQPRKHKSHDILLPGLVPSDDPHFSSNPPSGANKFQPQHQPPGPNKPKGSKSSSHPTRHKNEVAFDQLVLQPHPQQQQKHSQPRTARLMNNHTDPVHSQQSSSHSLRASSDLSAARSSVNSRSRRLTMSKINKSSNNPNISNISNISNVTNIANNSGDLTGLGAVGGHIGNYSNYNNIKINKINNSKNVNFNDGHGSSRRRSNSTSVSSSGSGGDKTWQCRFCTLINSISRPVCAACGGSPPVAPPNGLKPSLRAAGLMAASRSYNNINLGQNHENHGNHGNLENRDKMEKQRKHRSQVTLREFELSNEAFWDQSQDSQLTRTSSANDVARIENEANANRNVSKRGHMLHMGHMGHKGLKGQMGQMDQMAHMIKLGGEDGIGKDVLRTRSQEWVDFVPPEVADFDAMNDEEWDRLHQETVNWDAEVSGESENRQVGSLSVADGTARVLQRRFEQLAMTIMLLHENASALMNTLSSVAKKIMSRPEAKYRTLNTNNDQVVSKLLGFEGVTEFLNEIGFEPDQNGTKLVVKQPDYERIKLGIAVLSKYRLKVEGNIANTSNTSNSRHSASATLASRSGSNGLSGLHALNTLNSLNPPNRMDSFLRPLSSTRSSQVSSNGSLTSPRHDAPSPSNASNASNGLHGLHGIDAKQEELMQQEQQEEPRVWMGPDGKVASYVTPDGTNGDDANDVALITAMDNIIGWATHQNAKDSDLVKTLLLTHKTFTDSDRLLTRLIHRYDTVAPRYTPTPSDAWDAWDTRDTRDAADDRDDAKIMDDDANNRKHNKHKTRHQRTGSSLYNFSSLSDEAKVQVKVVEAIREWMKNYWILDFKHRMNLQFKVESFAQAMQREASAAEQMGSKHAEPWKQKLSQLLLNELKRLQSPNFAPPPASMVVSTFERQYHNETRYAKIVLDPKMDRLDKVPFTKLAEQMTIRTFELFCNIQPRELVNKAWADEETRDTYSSNVYALIREFNFLSEYCTLRILNYSERTKRDFKQRVKVMGNIVKMCVKLLKLSNFHCLYAVYSALRVAPILRLKKEFSKLSRRETHWLNQFEQIFSCNRNFKKLRDHMHSAKFNKRPCVPYLGTFLTDLTFITDGNKTYIDNPLMLTSSRSSIEESRENSNIVNFNKCIRIRECIKNLQGYQMIKYDKVLVRDEKIQKLLFQEFEDWREKDETGNKLDLYQLSCTIYPSKNRRVTYAM